MSVRIAEGRAETSYKTEDFFALVAIFGDEIDHVKFVGLYHDDDLVELQLDPETMALSQVTLTNCRRFDICAGTMPVPNAEEGIVVLDLPKRVDCADLWTTVFDDGVLVQVTSKLSVGYVRMGDVTFGLSADDNLTSIYLANLSQEEISHVRAELSGEGYDDVWVPRG